MNTEASRGLGYAGVPCGTSSKNRLKGSEGRRLKAKWYQYGCVAGSLINPVSFIDFSNETHNSFR